jgi:hypothetical protein
MNIRKWNIKWELIDGYELLILSGYPTDEDTEPWDEHVRLLWKYLKDEGFVRRDDAQPDNTMFKFIFE